MTNCQVNSYMGCPNPISYGAQPSSDTNRLAWAEDPAFDFQCLKGGAHSLTGNFSFGIYSLAVPIVQDIRTPINRIVLPLFWGIMTMRCEIFKSLHQNIIVSRHYNQLIILTE